MANTIKERISAVFAEWSLEARALAVKGLAVIALIIAIIAIIRAYFSIVG